MPDTPHQRVHLPLDNPLTQAVLGAAIEVSNTLGSGFLEKVYERALAFELTSRGFQVDSQPVLPVYYKATLLAEYIPDLLINQELIVELKCIDRIGPVHIAQALNYLKASRLTLALILNFQHPRLEWRRVVP